MCRESDLVLSEVIRTFRLSDVALSACGVNPQTALSAILIGWHVVIEGCLSSDEKWKLKNSPEDDVLLAELREIYTTNWPNKRICRALQFLYGAEPQEWWEMQDIRALLDLAIRSALEAAFASWEEMPEDG